MKIYIAGSFDDAVGIEMLSKKLESLGHDTSPHWWESNTKKMFTDLPMKEWLKQDIVKDWYTRDVDATRKCYLFIWIRKNNIRY